MASSSSSSSLSLSTSWSYHVFLSFCGVDVRKRFLSHVLNGLKSKGIIVFIDDEMNRGQFIDDELKGAIRQSRVAVVLLSRNYPSSSWCLDELVEIMKCREAGQQTVMPVFYEVDPSHVRKQTGDFGKAFDETCVGKTEEVKKAWRQALKDVASIAGYHSSKCKSEADLINTVASDVTDVLGFTPSKDFDDFVGIQSHITEIKSKMILQSEQVKVIVLVGPPGIGKTTTARALYNQLSPGFLFNTFLENIRRSYEKPCGDNYPLKLRLHKNLLSQLLNQRDIKVGHLGVAQEMLRGKKLLFVLDEVDNLWQLEAIGSIRGYLGPGSIVIITTEDTTLVKTLGLGIDHIYQLKTPTSEESLKIFCQYAFGQKSPETGFERLALNFTCLAGDLPLGLRVMGSYLRGRPRDEWIEALPWLRSTLDGEIESTLRLSYDALRDNEKALFLHIACFFFGYEVDRFKSFLANSRLEVNYGLQVLANKSLISIENGYIMMHRLLEQMGKEIVKKQSLEEPGKRQFLWDNTEISDVLEENTGTGTVLGIRLHYLQGEGIQMSKSAFDEMNNLQFLYVNHPLHTPEGLNCFPDKIRFLEWDECPLRLWPSKFSGKFLVELLMPSSNFEKLWEDIQPLKCLKLMDLRDSYYLKEIPDLSKATSLEKLDLHNCTLLEFTSSIHNATEVDLSETKIKEMPSSISTWSCLYRLNISWCKHIKDFPNVSDSIVELDLRMTGIKEVPPWIEKLFRLRKLSMLGCKKLKDISPNISKLENLEFLGLSIHGFREKDDEHLNFDPGFFRADIEWGIDFKRSWTLRTDFNVHFILPICLPEKVRSYPISLRFRGGDCFKKIADCISLSRLIKLDIRNCTEIISLPQLPDSLLSIDAHGCYSLKRIDSTFQNPNICLNFAHCFNLSKKARTLIQTSACKYAFLPGETVPAAHFTHRASSGSLTINLTPTPLPSSFRFRACILLSEEYDINLEDHNDEKQDLMRVSCHVSCKQNGLTVRHLLHHMSDVYGCAEHLYIFEESFSLNQDCPEAEETTLNELTFVFRVHNKFFNIKSCGVRLLDVPYCIIDRNANDDDDDDDDVEVSSSTDYESELVPGVEVPAHFPHQATSDSLTINTSPTNLPLRFKFRACISLSRDVVEEGVPWRSEGLSDLRDGDDDENLLMRVSYRGEHNGVTVSYGANEHDMPYIHGFEDRLYIFDDYLSLNQYIPGIGDAHFSKLAFQFEVFHEKWKVKSCGVRLFCLHTRSLLYGRKRKWT